MRGLVMAVVVGLLLGETIQTVEPVSIRIQPAFVFAGQAMRVTCTVPRHKDNRTLAIGVSDTYQSTRDLLGEQSAVTHVLLVEEIPCEAQAAYCVLGRAGGSEFLAQETIRVVGCEQ